MMPDAPGPPVAPTPRWVILGSATIVAIALAVQALIPPSADVAWYLHVAGRMLGGERLYSDIIEVNPPLVMWLDVPVVWLANVLRLPAAAVFRSVVGLAGIGSLLLCGHLLRRSQGPPADPCRRLLLLLLATILFPMAGHDFGEREHLLLILALPYLFLTFLRCDGERVGLPLAVTVGLLAGLGISFKPYFILLPLGVELGARRAGISRTLRAETIAIGVWVLGYMASVSVFTPGYWALLRDLGPLYFQFARAPLVATALASDGAGVALCAILAAAALRRRARGNALGLILLVATISLYVAGGMQQKGWRYHFYPAAGVGLLLLGMLSKPEGSRGLSVGERVYQAVALAVVIFVPGLALLSDAARLLRPTGGQSAAEIEYHRMAEMVLREAPGGTLLALSSDLASAFPLVLETELSWKAPLPSLWPLQASYQRELASPEPLLYRTPEMQGDLERWMNGVVYESLVHTRPDILLVTRAMPDRVVWGGLRFDYFRYFLHQPAFTPELARYTYLGEIGQYRIFRRLKATDSVRQAAPPPQATRATPPTRIATGVYLVMPSPVTLLEVGLFLLVGTVLFVKLPHGQSEGSIESSGQSD